MDIHICIYVRLIVDYWCMEKLERQVGTVGGEGEPREDSQAVGGFQIGASL